MFICCFFIVSDFHVCIFTKNFQFLSILSEGGFICLAFNHNFIGYVNVAPKSQLLSNFDNEIKNVISIIRTILLLVYYKSLKNEIKKA